MSDKDNKIEIVQGEGGVIPPKPKLKINMSVKQTTLYLILFFSFFANILVDYISFGFDISMFTNAPYWLKLLTTNSVLILLTIVSRGSSKEKELNNNEIIKGYRKELYNANVTINKYGLVENFIEYIKEVNIKREKEAYKNKLIKKYNSPFVNQLKKDEIAKKIGNIDKIEDYDKYKLKYERITFSSIFNSIEINNTSSERLTVNNKKAIINLILNKIIYIFCFSILVASILNETKFSDGITIALMLNTVIKVMQCSWAIYVGYSDGIYYVQEDIRTVLANRITFVQRFLENNKQLIEERKKTLEKANIDNNITKDVIKNVINEEAKES